MLFLTISECDIRFHNLEYKNYPDKAFVAEIKEDMYYQCHFVNASIGKLSNCFNCGVCTEDAICKGNDFDGYNCECTGYCK